MIKALHGRQPSTLFELSNVDQEVNKLARFRVVCRTLGQERADRASYRIVAFADRDAAIPGAGGTGAFAYRGIDGGFDQ
jgi:hypothetical protein